MTARRLCTISEAAVLAGRDEATIKRDRQSERYPGAFQKPGDNRGTWLIPLEDLIAAGRVNPDRLTTDHQGGADVTALRTELQAEREAHAETRALLAAAQAAAAASERHADALLKVLAERLAVHTGSA